MGAFYGIKIMTGVINPATGKAWQLTDVPAFWQPKVEAYLKEAEND